MHSSKSVLKLRTLGLVLLLSLGFAIPTGAARQFGLGMVVGDPTGFTAKLWTSSTTAFDFNIGWSGYWRNDRYYNSNCYDPDYYADNRPYCRGQRYGYDDRYNDGWNSFHMHADYLFHNFSFIRSSERFALFAGPGIALNYLEYDYLEFGPRGNFGIAWMAKRVPMDVFFELAPGIFFMPRPRGNLDGGLGARFFF